MLLAGRARQRSRAKENRAPPGRRGTRGWGALRKRPTRQRVAAAGAGARPGWVMMRQGVRCSCAMRLKRRDGVSSTQSKRPKASARLPDRKPSSSAPKASASDAVSTMRRRLGSRPRRFNPNAEGAPNSRLKCRGQHHISHGRAGAQDAWDAEGNGVSSADTRRAAKRSAKPMLVIQAAAEAPCPSCTAFTSCTPRVSRPEAGSSLSASGQPKCQPGDAPALETSNACGPSILAMARRRVSRTSLAALGLEAPGRKAPPGAVKAGPAAEPESGVASCPAAGRD